MERCDFASIAKIIRDDLLDVVGDEETFGKPIGSDRDSGKSTFVTLKGLEACQIEVEKETDLALSALEKGGFLDTEFLTWLARSLTGRMK